MVWPSGAALTAASAPIMPAAPGRFSTTTGWPSCALRLGASARPTLSRSPPGGKGTIIFSGLVGNSAACATAIHASQAKIIEKCLVIEPPLRGAVRALPVLSVLAHDGHVLERAFVEAARIHAVTVGMRARHVERFHAAYRAEEVARGAGVELVGGQNVGTGKQPEPLLRHDEMEVPRSRAHRAVALGDLDARGSERLEAHPAAMAASPMRDHRPTLTQNPLTRRRGVRAGAAPRRWPAR